MGGTLDDDNQGWTMAGSPSRQKCSKWPVFKSVGAGERFHGLNGRSWNEGGLIACMGQLMSKTAQAVTGASVIVTQHPDPQRVALNVIQEVIGKPIQIGPNPPVEANDHGVSDQ